MIQSTEELISTSDLIGTNKRISNKILPVGQPKFKAIKIQKQANQKHIQKQ
jgi:hypothetical protein